MPALQYASAPTIQSRRLVGHFFRAAVVCGISPMVAGLLILCCYWITKRDWFATAGLWTLAIGVVVIVLGIAAWIVAVIGQKKIARADGVRMRWRAPTWALVLLLGNLPVGALCIAIGMDLVFTTYVDVINETTTPLTCAIDFGQPSQRKSALIAPGKRFRITHRSGFWRDPINLSLHQGSSTATINEPEDGWIRFHIRPDLTSNTERIH